MDKKLKDKWIEALRSDEYEQAIGTLYTHTDAGAAYCCLGVLGKCMDYKESEMLGRAAISSLWQQKGIRVVLSNKQEIALMNLNDIRGKSFREIADYIEKNVRSSTSRRNKNEVEVEA